MHQNRSKSLATAVAVEAVALLYWDAAEVIPQTGRPTQLNRMQNGVRNKTSRITCIVPTGLRQLEQVFATTSDVPVVIDLLNTTRLK